MTHKISIYIFHLLLFLVAFNSSFKYFYASNVWNLLQIFLAFLLILISILDEELILKVNILSLCAVLLLTVLCLSSFFYSNSYLDQSDIFKFTTLVLLMLCGLIYGRFLNVIFFVKVSTVFIVSFVFIFAVFRIVVMDSSANYLMFSMGVAFVSIANLGISYRKGWDLKWLFIGVSLLFYCFTLQSRAAIIYPLFFLLIFVFIFHFESGKLMRLMFLFLFSISFIALFFLLLDIQLIDLAGLGYGAYKLISMFTGDYSDDRNTLASSSFNFVIDNPFGHGVGSHWELLGYYPHNFFLEVLLNFGVFVFLLYFLITILSIYAIFKAKDFVCWFYSLFYLYYLAIWMSSFDFLSSFQIHLAIGCLLSCLFLNKKSIA